MWWSNSDTKCWTMRTSHHSVNINLGNVKRRTPNRNGHKLLIMLFINLSFELRLLPFIHRICLGTLCVSFLFVCSLFISVNFGKNIVIKIERFYLVMFLFPIFLLSCSVAGFLYTVCYSRCIWQISTTMPSCNYWKFY